MTRPLKVFLSHAHADADAVRALYDRLVADGVDAWLDKEKLIPGQDWEREIRKAVREADVVIVCHSTQFNQRGYRQKEVRWALEESKMIPEGEIFIIPAKLEECEILESLRNIHWVDLFEDDGYERLLKSLHLRSETAIPSFAEVEKHTKKSLSSVIDGLNWKAASGSRIFHGRLSDAFPGLRGHQRFTGKEACDRLQILLKEPHSLALDLNGGEITPFWWLRGISNMFIHKFERLGDEHVLLNINQLHINFIEAVRSFTHPEKNFVYIQAHPEPPTGIHDYGDFSIPEYLEKQLEAGYGYYLDEEYGVWQDKIITRSEFDDGSAIIEGKPVRTSDANLRTRYITPYNLVVCGDNHVLNDSKIDFDVTKLFNEILLEKKNINDLIEYISRLSNKYRD